MKPKIKRATKAKKPVTMRALQAENRKLKKRIEDLSSIPVHVGLSGRPIEMEFFGAGGGGGSMSGGEVFGGGGSGRVNLHPLEVAQRPALTSLDGRKLCLEKAREYVTRDRNASYGDPEDNFFTIGNLWSEHLRGKIINVGSITPTDVAAMMILMKVARLKTSPESADNWIDISGYGACGAGIRALPSLEALRPAEG